MNVYSVRFGSDRVGSDRVGSVRFESVRPGSSRFKSIRYLLSLELGVLVDPKKLTKDSKA